MSDQKNIIGTRIKAARKVKGLTQRELGLQVNLDQAFLSRVENGTSTPAPDQLNVIAQTLGVSVGYLFGTDEQEGGLSEETVELALKIQQLAPEQRAAVRQLINTITS